LDSNLDKHLLSGSIQTLTKNESHHTRKSKLKGPKSRVTWSFGVGNLEISTENLTMDRPLKIGKPVHLQYSSFTFFQNDSFAVRIA
jgi:hypothetical protein